MWPTVKANIIRRFVDPAGQLLLNNKPVAQQQQQTLRYLLSKSRNTAFGQHFNFQKLLQLPDSELCKAYREAIQVFHYLTIEPWWRQVETGDHQACWGGQTRYMALSSGTTSGSSKHIPVSDDMIRTTQQASKAFIAHALRQGVRADTLGRQVLSIGGSTTLDSKHGLQYGMFSGIVFGQSPWYWQTSYKPGRAGQALTKWSDKMDYIARHAAEWDIGAIYGFPCWVTPILEKIQQQHGVANMTELWPNLQLYTYSGMKIDPYRDRLTALLGPDAPWLETYVASEGYFAIQQQLGQPGLRLLTSNEIYYELIPFNDSCFDAFGYPYPDAPAISLAEATPGIDYALVVTNNSGAWRYVPGDVVHLLQNDPPLISFVGRTALYVNDCGERVSIGNLEMAFARVVAETRIQSTDFALQSVANQGYFHHHWYIETPAAPDDLAVRLDNALQTLNDDYHKMRTEGAIRSVEVTLLPPGTFHRYLAATGRDNGQSKTPRVLKGTHAESWEKFLRMTNDE